MMNLVLRVLCFRISSLHRVLARDGLPSGSRRHDRSRHHGLGHGRQPDARRIQRDRVRRAGATRVRIIAEPAGTIAASPASVGAAGGRDRLLAAFVGRAAAGRGGDGRLAAPAPDRRRNQHAADCGQGGGPHARWRPRQTVLLDCPLSGTGAQAKIEDLVVYASGDRRRIAGSFRCSTPFARAHYFVGAFGTGSKMKFVANLLVAVHNVAAAEAIVLAMKAGLDPAMVVKVIGDGAGSSRMFQVRGPMMAKGDYSEATMKLDVWQKDMTIIADFARRGGVPDAAVRRHRSDLHCRQRDRAAHDDTAAVCAVLERMANHHRKRQSQGCNRERSQPVRMEDSMRPTTNDDRAESGRDGRAHRQPSVCLRSTARPERPDQGRGGAEREGRPGHLRRLRGGRRLAEEARRPFRATRPGRSAPGQSVFAESPDRVYVVQRGELPEIPRPMTKKLSDLGPSIAFPIGRLPWRDATTASPPGNGGSGQLAEGGMEAWARTQQDGRRRPLGALHPGVRRPGQPAAETANWMQWDASLQRPHFVAISPYDPEKNVWIIDDHKHVIYKFTHDGKTKLLTIGTYGVPGADDKHFNRPTYMDWLPDGSFFVGRRLQRHARGEVRQERQVS